MYTTQQDVKAEAEKKESEKGLSVDEITEMCEKYGIDWNHIREDIIKQKESMNEVRLALAYTYEIDYLPQLEELIKNCSDEDLIIDDTNALMWAALKSIPSPKIDFLKKYKIDFVKKHINDTDSEGKTALHYLGASENGHVEALDTLVELGIDIDALDKYGWSALHDMAYCINEGLGEAFFKYSPTVFKNKKGHTPGDLERIGSDFTVRNTFIDYEGGRPVIDYKDK